MGYTVYFNNWERYCRSQVEAEATAKSYLALRQRWTAEWDAQDPGSKARTLTAFDSHGNKIRSAVIVTDVRSGLDVKEAAQYDAFNGGRRTTVINTDEAEAWAEKHMSLKGGFRVGWDYDSKNEVWVYRVFSVYDGRQVNSLVLVPRIAIKPKIRRRLIKRQPVEVVEPEPTIKGGWEEAERIMLLPGLAADPAELDVEIWAHDLDGNVDVTLPDGSQVHIDA